MRLWVLADIDMDGHLVPHMHSNVEVCFADRRYLNGDTVLMSTMAWDVVWRRLTSTVHLDRETNRGVWCIGEQYLANCSVGWHAHALSHMTVVVRKVGHRWQGYEVLDAVGSRRKQKVRGRWWWRLAGGADLYWWCERPVCAGGRCVGGHGEDETSDGGAEQMRSGEERRGGVWKTALTLSSGLR